MSTSELFVEWGGEFREFFVQCVRMSGVFAPPICCVRRTPENFSSFSDELRTISRICQNLSKAAPENFSSFSDSLKIIREIFLVFRRHRPPDPSEQGEAPAAAVEQTCCSAIRQWGGRGIIRAWSRMIPHVFITRVYSYEASRARLSGNLRGNQNCINPTPSRQKESTDESKDCAICPRQ